MRAVLLAAGVGSRLRPLTDTTPKCLAPVLGRPLIDYWLERLFPCFERVLVNTHHLGGTVRAHIAHSPWRERIDLVHEDELLGTAGTLANNRDWLGEGPVLVAHADNLTDFDPEAFLAAHCDRPDGCVMTMLTFETDAPRTCGILELDERAVVQGFHEKVEDPPGVLANAAVYLIENEVLDTISALSGPVLDLSTQVIPEFVGRIFAVEHRGYHRDIGNLASLAKANADFALRPLPDQSKLS